MYIHPFTKGNRDSVLYPIHIRTEAIFLEIFITCEPLKGAMLSLRSAEPFGLGFSHDHSQDFCLLNSRFESYIHQDSTTHSSSLLIPSLFPFIPVTSSSFLLCKSISTHHQSLASLFLVFLHNSDPVLHSNSATCYHCTLNLALAINANTPYVFILVYHYLTTRS